MAHRSGGGKDDACICTLHQCCSRLLAFASGNMSHICTAWQHPESKDGKLVRFASFLPILCTINVMYFTFLMWSKKMVNCLPCFKLFPPLTYVHTAQSPGMSRETFEDREGSAMPARGKLLVEASPKLRKEGRHPKNLCVSSLSLHVLLFLCFGCSLRKLHIFQQPGHCTIPCDCCLSMQ